FDSSRTGRAAPAGPAAGRGFGFFRAAVKTLSLREKIDALDSMALTASDPHALQIVNALKMDVVAFETLARERMRAGSGTDKVFRIFRLEQGDRFFDEGGFDDLVPQAC